MNDAVRPAAEPSAAAGGAGAVLHAERRRQNLSLVDVSRHRPPSVRQGEALERDDFSPFGGPVFVHGFIRNYAKLLGVDAEPLVQAADAKLKPPEPEPAESEAPAPARKPARQNLAALALVIFVVGAGTIGYFFSRAPQPDAPPASAPVAAPAETTASEGPAAAEGVAPALDAGSGAAPAEPSAPVETAVLRMMFDQESWVEVRDRSGQAIFAQLNPAGARRRVSGEPPFSVVVGNAAGVRLSFNDREIDLEPHTRVDVARLTLQ